MHPIPVPPPQHLLTLVCVASLLIQAGCAPEKRTDTPIDAAAKKVLFIGIDGLRGDGIPNSDTPNLDSLTAQGRWTMFASTQLQASTVSGPGWTSMLTGVDADKHGIVENGGWTGIDRDYPTLIGRAHSLGLSTLTAIHWFPIQLNIIEADVTDKFTLGADEVITDHMR